MIAAYNTHLDIEASGDEENDEAAEFLKMCDDVFYEHESELDRILAERAAKIEP